MTGRKVSLKQGHFGKKKFTVITDVYWKLPLLRQTIESVLNQTYKNIEFIIVNNGASKDIISYINKIKEQDERVVVINYEENIFSWDDPTLYLFVCCNAALKIAKGDYIFYTSYDDPLSLDYVERMVKLFENNPKCTTAAGRPVSIDIDNNVNEEELNNRKSNFRSTYMPGRILALETLKYKQNMFAAPGTIFAIRRDIFLKYGGFHRCVESSQLYGIVPFGETGFDEDAIYYWRRHGGQLNRTLVARGHTGFQETMLMLHDCDILNRWEIFGEETARYVVNQITKQTSEKTALHAINNLLAFKIQAFAFTFKLAHGYMWFNIMLFKNLFISTPKVYYKIVRYPIVKVLKSIIRTIDVKFPNIKYRFDGFNSLAMRANRRVVK